MPRKSDPERPALEVPPADCGRRLPLDYDALRGLARVFFAREDARDTPCNPPPRHRRPIADWPS